MPREIVKFWADSKDADTFIRGNSNELQDEAQKEILQKAYEHDKTKTDRSGTRRRLRESLTRSGVKLIVEKGDVGKSLLDAVFSHLHVTGLNSIKSIVIGLQRVYDREDYKDACSVVIQVIEEVQQKQYEMQSSPVELSDQAGPSDVDLELRL